MELGKLVMDKELFDRHGNRAGKVDNLVLEMGDAADGAPPPEVIAIVSGPLAVAEMLPRPVLWLARTVYQLLGVHHPHSVEIPWSKVKAIDVVVHADIDRRQDGLLTLADAVDRRLMDHLPGAGIRP